MDPNFFLNSAFTGTSTHLLKPTEPSLFESSTSKFLINYKKYLSFATLNINSITSKFQDILFMLNGQLKF